MLISGSQSLIKWASTSTGNVKIELSADNGATWTLINNSAAAETFEYQWTVPSFTSGQCKIRISSVDNPTIIDETDGTFNIIPANSFYNVPELVYYRFNNGINTTPNYAVPGEIFGDADIVGMTLQSGGIADSCLVGEGGNGITNYVNTNWATYLNPSGWTIGFWISSISLGIDPNNAVYLFGDVTANNLRCYYGGAGGLTANDTAIMFRCTGLLDIRIPVVQGQTYYIHIVYESNPSVIKIYKNGVLSQTEERPPILAIGNGPLTIGSHATFASSLAANMKLDEFRIYNRSVGQEEINKTWNRTFTTVITGIQHLQSGVISDFKLYDNYPNPFNPSTKINFDVPYSKYGSHNVILSVYDVLGKLQQVLINQPLLQGKYSVNFNAENFSAGVYFYRLKADGVVVTKRMVLVK